MCEKGVLKETCSRLLSVVSFIVRHSVMSIPNVYFSNIEKYNDKKISLNIPDNLINQKMHTLELSNWLNFLKNQV